MVTKNSNSNLLDALLDSITPEEQHRTDNRMLLAAQIADALEAKGISQIQLAKTLGKHHSVITKWLSGTHNFTVDTLSDIECALGINLIQSLDNQPIINATYVPSSSTEARSFRRTSAHRQANTGKHVKIKPITNPFVLYALPKHNDDYSPVQKAV